MNRIELSGKSQGKGRNGYFQLHSVELMNIPTDPDGQVLNIDFYPRRRVNCVGPARLLLNVEDATKLAQFLGEAVESRPPVANIEHGELVCECGHRGTPRLEESGYQVSHALVEIVGDTIIASGWDGSSRAVSEEGDAYWLMCDGCGKLHPLPPELHIDWRLGAPYRRVAGVMITSLTPREVSTAKARYRGLRPSASSPVIEQLADLPGPKKQANISKRGGEVNG